MLRLSLTYPSQTLLTSVRLEIGLPCGFLSKEPPWPVVWALHPAMADGGIFFEGLDAGEFIDARGFALIAPSLGNGYFCNTSFQNQAAFLGEICDYLPDILPLQRMRDGNTVLGISMGGYGAVRWGLDSNAFGRIIAISGVFNPDLPPDEKLFKNRSQKTLYRALDPLMRERLGNYASRKDLNLEILISRQENTKKAIHLYCGEEDYLSLNHTLWLERLCSANDCPCELNIASGEHNVDYWRKSFREAILNHMK